MKTRLLCSICASVAVLALAALLLATLSASAAPQGSPVATWTDDFSSPTLNSQWSWINEGPPYWSLTQRPGFLRIMSEKGNLTAGTNRNLLLRTAPAGDFEIRTRLLFTPTANIQQAGLLIYQDDQDYLMVSRSYCGFVPQCIGNGIYFDQMEHGYLIGGNFAITTTAPNEAYLRMIRQGAVYTGYVSMNGTDWTMLGAHTVVSGLVPTKVGFAVHDVGFGAPEIPADFDFFQLTDESGTWTDTFSTNILDSPWAWTREHTRNWSLTERPGYMRITTTKGGLYGPGGDAHDVLAQSAPIGSYEIQTHVFFTPTQNFQGASLLIYQDVDNYITLSRGYCGYGGPTCIGNGIYFDQEEQGVQIGGVLPLTTTATGEAYLRIRR